MKFFKIGGKPCRALQFDKSLLGSNKEKLAGSNVFVRSIPKNQEHEDLQKKFESIGKIKSLKVSLNSDHSSRGYGFICFNDEATATKAIEASAKDEDTVAMKFEPKDRRNIRKLINNVYVKNIPMDYPEDKIKDMFKAFGEIKSLHLMKNQIGQIAFVCYDDPKGVNKEYGPECAQKAIDGLNGKELEGAPSGQKLYVRHAMKKSDREIEKKKETLRYKTSKKRCNLYVKNFPLSWDKEKLESVFSQFGAIENIKLEKGKNGNYAFVCYKQPDSAAVAKANLNNATFEGKTLIINHYEIKEQRKIQIEDAIDKADFEKYQAQKTGAFHLNDLTSHPHMTQILQQLLDIMQQNQAMNAHFNQQERNMMGRPQNRRPGQYQGGPRGYGGQQRPNGQMNQPGPNGMMPNGQPGMPMPMGQRPGGPMGPPMPQGGMMPPQPGAPMGAPIPPGGAMGATPSNPVAAQYQQVAAKISGQISEKNPYLKERVGEAIFPFIKNLVGNERVPKITGMLIELPVEQIKQYMFSYDNLVMKVKEADDLISQAEQQ